MTNRKSAMSKNSLILAGAALWTLGASTVHAQQAPAAGAAADEAVEDIVVTATKRAGGVTVQRTPLSVSAFGAANLDTMHVAALSDLTNNVPNVNLNATTSFPGFSNFTIRGMSVYSTIPSSTPTVGVFVDGIYQGTPAGAGFNTFDLAGVEVLRGPQGLFFGRNVTGGAILARTSAPSDSFHINGQVSVETGLNKVVSGVVTGPLSENLSGKLGVYYADDDGYFHNLATGKDIGKSHTLILRGGLKLDPPP